MSSELIPQVFEPGARVAIAGEAAVGVEDLRWVVSREVDGVWWGWSGSSGKELPLINVDDLQRGGMRVVAPAPGDGQRWVHFADPARRWDVLANGALWSGMSKLHIDDRSPVGLARWFLQFGYSYAGPADAAPATLRRLGADARSCAARARAVDPHRRPPSHHRDDRQRQAAPSGRVHLCALRPGGAWRPAGESRHRDRGNDHRARGRAPRTRRRRTLAGGARDVGDARPAQGQAERHADDHRAGRRHPLPPAEGRVVSRDDGEGRGADARADRERDIEERRQRRGETDVNYGASEEQVPAEGWVT